LDLERNIGPPQMVKSFQTNLEDTFRKFPGPISLPSPVKWWNAVLIGCALVILSILLRYLADEGTELTLWIVAMALFSIGCIAIGATLFLRPGACLRLDKNGFEVVGPLRKQQFRWSEVSDFGVWSRNKSSFVAFNSANRRLTVSDRLNVALTGGKNAMLPDSYGMPADDLVQLMIAWRNSALNATEPTGS
jgi:hypothetical protein